MFSIVPAGGNPAALLHNLNLGPNFRDITHKSYDRQLPSSWRMSFGRLASTAYPANEPLLSMLTVKAFDEFEIACSRLLRSSQGGDIRPLIEGGVAGDHATRQVYLNHATPFSARRLDIVINGGGNYTVCENDEMPGGLVHTYWLDRAYGVNQGRWQRALNWLTSDGLLVFAVSADYGAPYVEEIRWFAQHLRQLGYNVTTVTSKEVGRLRQRANHVTCDGQKISTVWRLFPVFEAHKAFTSLVAAAQKGQLRMVPELASWGNKAWLGVFWRQQTFFQNTMSPTSFQLLQRVLPYSNVVADRFDDFPMHVRSKDGWVTLNSYEELQKVPTALRKQLLAKTCGAHDRAARSLGVVLGTSLTGTKWGQALEQGKKFGPYVVQEYRSPIKASVPVWSVLSGQPQLDQFDCKMLVRPWAIGNELVSATLFLTAADSSKLHGTTTGAEVPLNLG